MKTTNQIIRPMLPTVLEQSVELLKQSNALGLKSVEDVIYFVDNETNISEWVGRGFLHQDFGFTEEETIQRAKEEEQFNDERFNKFKEFEQPVDIIYKALMKRVEKFLYKAKQMNDVFGPKSNKEIIEILQRPILINNLQRLSYLVIMIYDGYTGEHQPKIFNIENKLWSKLVGTDSDKLTPDTFKMPFDTMVVRFDNHKHYFYTKFGSTFGKENTTGIDCILREFVVTSNGSGDFCFYFPFQSAKVDMKEHVGDNDEFGITYKALNSDNKEIKVDINALSIYNDFFMIQIPFNPKDLLFGATYKGRLIDKTMSNAVSVFLKHFKTSCNEIYGQGVFTTVHSILSGFFNLLLYINSINAKIDKVLPKRTPPNINGKRTSTTFESFNGYDTIKLVSNLIADTGISGTDKIIQCPKWDVRGHWRQQAIGQAKKERRLIWIEPYTKGVLREESTINSANRDYSTPYQQ